MVKKKKNAAPLKPLREFNFGLVTKKLEGLLINVDRDLQRYAEQALQSGNQERERCLVLLNIMVRFAHNSYNSVRYLCADTPEDPNRKPNYVLVVPNINRQLLDMLFSLVYMLDDLEVRSLQYQQAGWRELFEEYKQYHTRFSKDPEWTNHFAAVEAALNNSAVRFKISPEQRQNPKSIDYWGTPTQLKDKPTKSRQYLRYLTKWLYGDTSAQAHLSFGGMLKVAPFILAAVGGDAEEMVKNRTIHQYRYQAISRSSIIALAIGTEINNHYHLENEAQVDYLWTIFSEYSAEGKEMYEARYKKT